MQLGGSAKLGGKGPAQCRWGERAFGNLHEQSAIFLVGLWLHAAFFDVDGAAALGWTYLAIRALYPIVWALNGGMTMKQLGVTMPMYGIVIWLIATTVAQVNFGVDLKKAMLGSDVLGVAASVGVFFAVFMFNSAITQNVVQAFFKNDKAAKKS